MSNPLVTVIIPAYNCSNFIAKAINSVLCQTYSPFELLVVDDGSTDDTAIRVQQFGDKLTYIYQRNGGVSKARNTGILASRGTYLAFLDADDVWEKNKLEIQVNIIRNLTDVKMICSGFHHIKNEILIKGKTYEDTFNIFKEYKYGVDRIYSNSSVYNYSDINIKYYWGNIYKYLFLVNFILPSSVLIDKQLLMSVGMFNEKYRVAEETELFLKISKSNKIGYIEFPLLYYEAPDSGNLSGKANMERLIKAALRIQIDSIMTNHEDYKQDPGFFDMGISTTYCRLAYYYLSEYRSREARKYALYGVSSCKFNLRSYMILLASCIPSNLLGRLAKIKTVINSTLRNRLA